MPVLLDLRRQCAGTRCPMRAVDQVQALIEHGACQAVPFDGWVTPRLIHIEKIAVLDEEQRLDEHRRYFFEARVNALWEPRRKHRRAAAVAQLQPSLVLLVISGEQA